MLYSVLILGTGSLAKSYFGKVLSPDNLILIQLSCYVLNVVERVSNKSRYPFKVTNHLKTFQEMEWKGKNKKWHVLDSGSEGA